MFLMAVNHKYISNPFANNYFAIDPKVNYLLGVTCATASAGMPSTASCLFTNPFTNTFTNSIFDKTYTNTNPFSYTPIVNNTFNYTGLNTGIGSLPTTLRLPMPPVPDFSIFPIPSLTFSAEKTSTGNNNAEPEGVNLKKDKTQYGPEFLNKVKEIAQRLNCNYRDLLGLMNSESGINASAKNPNGSASGLIQFVESTAQSLGTTTEALRAMSPIEQLDYVEKYLQNAKSAAGFSSNDKLSGGDLYALTFLPARAKNNTLTSAGENYYAHNKGLDKNGDGQITKDELSQRIQSFYVSDNTFLA